MKVITGTLENVEFTDKQVKVTIKEPGKGGAPDGGRWPASFSGFLDQVDEQVQVALQEADEGDTWSITVEESTKLNSKGNPYLNLVSATPGATGTHTTPWSGPPPPDPVDETWDNMSRPTATQPSLQPRSGPERPNAGPPPNPQAVGACANHAMAFIEMGVWPIPEGRDPMSWYRECRDFVYWHGNHVEVKPEPFCYEHDKAFQRGNTGYGHRQDDGWCIRGTAGIVLDPSQPETEEE